MKPPNLIPIFVLATCLGTFHGWTAPCVIRYSGSVNPLIHKNFYYICTRIQILRLGASFLY